MDEWSTEHAISLPSRPVLIEIPSDIFVEILDRLSIRDAVRLSLTCKAFHSAPLILAAIYEEPFTEDDFQKRYILLECHSKEFVTLRDNSDSIVAYYHGFNKSLNAHTGSFMRRLLLWGKTCDDCLLRYQELCPHICSIDFTAFYGISSAHWLHEIDSDNPKRGSNAPTYWEGLLSYTSLLSRLTSIRLNFYGLENRGVPRIRAEFLRSQFRTLLRTAQSLESIEICGPDNICRDHWTEHSEFDYLQQVVLCDAGPCLQKLGMKNLHSVVRNLKMFLEPLQGLSKLKTIALSVNGNLFFLDRERNMCEDSDDMAHPPRCQSDVTLQENTSGTVEDYLENLQIVDANPKWNIICLDSPEDFPLDPRAFCLPVRNGREHHIHWLRQRFSWTPVFTWQYNMRYEFEIQDRWEEGDPREPEEPLSIISSEKREEEIASCRAVFHAIKATGAPVQLLLPGSAYENAMLFDYDYDSDPIYYLDAHASAKIIAEDWYLNRIGDLADDLRMLWGGDAPDCTEKFADRVFTMENFSKRESDLIELEKEGLSSLWQDFAKNFSNLKRLQLYIPSVLYPARDDDDFIDTILPGKGWIVERPKNKYNKHNYRTYFSRTFVREAPGGELDSVVTSTAALEL